MGNTNELIGNVRQEHIDNLDKLIALKQRQIELLTEMRDIIVIAEHAGFHPKQILSSGYRAPSRGMWGNWSREARARLPYFHARHPCAQKGHKRVRTYVKLRSGEMHEFSEPVFLSGAPEAPKPKPKYPGWRG